MQFSGLLRILFESLNRGAKNLPAVTRNCYHNNRPKIIRHETKICHFYYSLHYKELQNLKSRINSSQLISQRRELPSVLLEVRTAGRLCFGRSTFRVLLPQSFNSHQFLLNKKGPTFRLDLSCWAKEGNWTLDLLITSELLYPWATLACNVNLPNFLSSVNKTDAFSVKHDYIISVCGISFVWALPFF